MTGRWGGRDSEVERTLYNPQESRERANDVAVTLKKDLSKEANFLQRWGERLRGKSASKQDAKMERLKSKIIDAIKDD